MEETIKHLEALREQMCKYNIDAVIIPGTDPHQSEYIGDHWKLRDWITGFTGSNGTAVITTDDARLWTDSRYFLQAEKELAGTGITMMKEDGGNDPTVNQWLAENLQEGDILAVNGKLFNIAQANQLENLCGQIGARFVADFDPFPAIYTDRPELPLDTIYEHEEQYSGESTESKIERLLQEVEAQGAEAIFISALDEIAWVYNIRCTGGWSAGLFPCINSSEIDDFKTTIKNVSVKASYFPENCSTQSACFSIVSLLLTSFPSTR